MLLWYLYDSSLENGSNFDYLLLKIKSSAVLSEKVLLFCKQQHEIKRPERKQQPQKKHQHFDTVFVLVMDAFHEMPSKIIFLCYLLLILITLLLNIN